MDRMLARGAWLALLAAALPGCGEPAAELSPACVEGPGVIERALARAPRAVALPDGTTLSACVSRAATAAELQDFGTVATRVAERLEARAATEPEAALRLGYLVGAARRGAEQTNGVNVELIRRFERSAALEDPSPAAERALVEGIEAGQALG
jgi:hypothetical protein